MIRILAVATLALCPPAAAAQGKKLLTLEQVSPERGGGVSFSARPPAVRWAADGVHLVVGSGRDAKLVHPETGDERKPKPEDLRSPRGGAARGIPGMTRRRFGRRNVPLPPKAGRGKLAARSPDGERYAFVRDHDLWVYSTKSERVVRLTSDGSEDRYNGELDWVYQEEVYGRGDYRAHWWSPDSQRIAFLSLWEKDVPVFAIVNPVPPPPIASRRRGSPPPESRPAIQYQPKVTLQRYPKPGQPNPEVKLGVASLDGSVVWADLDGFPKDCLIVRVGWAPDGRMLCMVQDRIQTWLELCAVDPATGARRRIVREESDSWTDRLPMPQWFEDGSFLWVSDRTGYRHLYLYDGDGKLRNAITSGPWGVSNVLDVDPVRRRIWFTATKDGAIDNHYYRIGFDGSGLTRLTHGSGWHSLSLDAARRYAIDTWDSLASPPRAQLVDENGEAVRDFGQSRVPAMAEYATGDYEVLKIPARDGHELDAALLKPVGHDPAERYPIWLPVYSGPHAPSVRNRWNGSGFNQLLAQRGCFVLQVNVRSSSPRALKLLVAKCYKQLGVQELRDLEDAVAWVCENRGGDPTRAGISGWSYGGFMAAYALTHSKAFALGVAGAGVYDWRLYDTIYTERYMSTPQRNPEGYDKTSCILGAKNLHGHLVLLHGTEDDNVHFQNCMQFVYALQQAGKDFDLMIFPNAMHGVRGPQGRQRMRITWGAIESRLLKG